MTVLNAGWSVYSRYRKVRLRPYIEKGAQEFTVNLNET